LQTLRKLTGERSNEHNYDMKVDNHATAGDAGKLQLK
jgi:hypothetical protein